MFLQLRHESLNIYRMSRDLVKDMYKITLTFPSEERYNLTSQIRRAALSVTLNLAEGSSRTSAMERKRYYEISRGSLVEVDAALEIAVELGYVD